MPRTLPTGLTVAELKKQGTPQVLEHLFELELADGSRHFWSTHECVATSLLSGAAQAFKPWVQSVGNFSMTMSLRADAGEFTLQNLSGNLLDRDVAALVKANHFRGAYCIYRRHYFPADADAFSLHFKVADVVEVTGEHATFRLVQRFDLARLSAYDRRFTRACPWRFTSAQCGYRRGELFLGKTTADIFSASSIGSTALALTPDLYREEVVMIIEGTGAGQERPIASNTATTFTPKTNWTTTPDGTSKFIVTGPGTMVVGVTLADIFSSNTIGKTGSGWTVDAYKDQHTVIIAGTGAGQRRKVNTNSATTLTVSPAWATTPDGTSVFIVVYASCAKSRADCNTRGVLERFAGIISSIPQTQLITGPVSLAPGGGGSGGGARDIGTRDYRELA